ncbi:hypothetical protein [Qipengyuania seohaensis]|uniref:hypothetical protein n=1 Tax=Qipengyuania seohaensis TaxID=266951 RepID=UPI000C21E8AC|nr:hypothetical protein [Qipengyuania seohaensis]
MSIDPETLPEVLRKQRGLRYRQPLPPGTRFLSHGRIIRAYAEHLIDKGERPTLDKVRSLLEWLDRDYSLNADRISFALRRFFKNGRMDRFTNGHQVRIGKEVFATKREAARALGIAPQTVKNRIDSTDPKWAEWSET